MMGHRFAVAAFTILALGLGGIQLLAQEERSNTEGTRLDRLEALTARLGLSDQQKSEVGKIQAEFDKKLEPVEQRLWSLHQEEFAACRKVITEDQRAKMRDFLKGTWEAETQKIAVKLNLNEDQKQRVQKIRADYGPKFCALMEKQGEGSFKEFRELRSKAHQELRQVLTEEQRALVPGIIHEEFHRWHDAATRREELTMVTDKVGLNNDQRAQFQQIMTEYNRQLEQPAGQFKQLHQDERAAIEKVLTAEQRAKFEAMVKGKGEK